MTVNERSIFIAALDKATPEEQAAFLDDACGPDVAKRRRIEGLLRSHVEAGTFLDTPALGAADTGAAPPPPALPPLESPGTRIGPYKLLEKLGEGGMGVVFMAEQQHPVRRRVALKIIKPGMDSAQVIARFEAERQALAMMDHTNIARVLDAGTTDQGRPYFVMELVNGTPITRYCDDGNLTLRERLGLFVDVCHAVQHAHQKGVIHRDIKPSNILVTMYDGKPVPKVIDFGVAKAVEQRLTERTLFTRYGVLVGTFEYMAPEQAEMSALGVDTRSDIYSLGVLLYELLTGTTPLQRERIREAAFADVLKLIREEEPPLPSTRLSSSGGALVQIGANRRTEPRRLPRLVRGELDWIVMKCLDKNRARRYETADGLARDVERHLNDEPVLASPPSRVYALRKFARRNKALLATAAVVTVALLAGAGLATWGMLDARRGRADAVRARDDAKGQAALALANAQIAQKEAVKARNIADFLKSTLAKANPELAGGPDVTVRQSLESAVKALDAGKAAAHPEVEGALRHTIGQAYMSLGLPNAAQGQLEAALRLQRETLGVNHPDVATTLYALAELWHAEGDWRKAADLYGEALKIRRMAFDENTQTVAITLARYADAVGRTGDLDTAEKLHEEALALNIKTAGEVSMNTAAVLNNRAIVLTSRNDIAGAEKLFAEARDIYRKVLGEKSSAVAKVNLNIARCKLELGDYAAAEPLLRQCLEEHRAIYGPDHTALLNILGGLYHILARRNDPEAHELQMESLRLLAVRATHEMRALPGSAFLVRNRGDHYGRLGRFAESLADRERLLELEPGDLEARFTAAIGNLYLNNPDRYRLHAREMVQRFANAGHPDAQERAAKALCLAPCDAADAALARDLADKALAAPMGENRVGWFRLTRALAEYRAGDHAGCVQSLELFWPEGEKINFGDKRYPQGTAHALAAMAHHRLGNAGKAKEHFDESARLMAECPEPGKRDLGVGPDNWVVWAIFHREANQLLNGPGTKGQASSTTER